MDINYQNFSKNELITHIQKMKEELEKRNRIEKEKRWHEVCDILYDWFKDYGKIDINSGEIYLNEDMDFSSFGEIDSR